MPLLEAASLHKHYTPLRSFGLRGNKSHVTRAVDGVDLSLDFGETLGLVGESGCGKSTLGRCLLRLIEPSSGKVMFDGVDVLSLNAGKLRQLRPKMQIVFQDPFGSLNPRMRIDLLLEEPMRAHRIVSSSDVPGEVMRLLDIVGMPRSAALRYPHEFSGGQRQRIGIARALSLRPKLIIADEPVSALDVSIRAQILNLFRSVQAQTGVALLFIAHDLGAVRQISRRVAVMYAGQIVEIADSEELYENPRHPYTRALLTAIPTVHVIKKSSPRDVPPPKVEPGSAMIITSGCRFRPRCPLAQDICATQDPALAAFAGGRPTHKSACHFAATLPVASPTDSSPGPILN